MKTADDYEAELREMGPGWFARVVAALSWFVLVLMTAAFDGIVTGLGVSPLAAFVAWLLGAENVRQITVAVGVSVAAVFFVLDVVVSCGKTANAVQEARMRMAGL